MKIYRLLLLVIASILVIAAKPGRGGGSFPWTQYKWGSNGAFSASGNGTNWSFATSGHNAAYNAIVITNNSGDLTGKTLIATTTVTTTSGNPQYVFGGQLSGWNTGPNPPSYRFYISSSPPPYSNQGYTACPHCYWWSNTGVAPVFSGVVTIMDGFDPTHWSNANGQSAVDFPVEFNAAVSNVKQCGLFFGGGSFYDVGVAILNGTGSATFTLNSFTIN